MIFSVSHVGTLLGNHTSLAACCGEQFCYTCIAAILQDKKPCPSCKEDTFTICMNKGDHRRILALHVCCTNKDRGCQWTGNVEQLDTHLDVNSGDCMYVDIECPEKCGQQVQKHQLSTHIANECPKRDFTCMHCGLKATYEVVSEQHWPVCQNYPVPCPNRCQIGAVERNTMEHHLKLCSFQVVDCEFSYAGCTERLKRQDMEKHIEENTQKHLALMASVSMKMKRELQDQRDEFRWCLKEQRQQSVREREEHQLSVRKHQQSVMEREERIESMQKSLQKEQNHVEENTQKHLALIQYTRMKMGREFEQKLQEQRDEFRGYLEQKERETEEQFKQTVRQIGTIQVSLQEQQGKFEAQGARAP